MTFTNEELSAIYRLAQAMAQADGKVTKEEIAVIILELQRFGVDQNKAKIIIEMSEKMSYSEACQIVSRMIPSENLVPPMENVIWSDDPLYICFSTLPTT